MGGYNGGDINDVWSSPDGITWTESTSNAAWSDRRAIASVVYDNKMWIMGGTTNGSEVWNSTDGSAWSLATSNAGWGGRNSTDAVVFNGRIWLIAGIDGTSKKNDVWHTTD